MKFAGKILLVIIIAAAIYIYSRAKQTWTTSQLKKQATLKQNYCSKIDPSQTIFVSVPSYRDPDCPMTVFECLENAACPLRIFVGVLEQNYYVDVRCMDRYHKLASRWGSGNYSEQIRIKSISANDAKGPMYARSMIEKDLYRGEKYYLVIDSHTQFTPRWDLNLIEMLGKCPSAKPVLTMYPSNHSRPAGTIARLDKNHKFYSQSTFEGNNPYMPSFLRFKKFNNKSGLPEIEGPLFKVQPLQPQPSLFWGGCFSFTLGEVIKQVPYDPNYPYVFMGEEIAMAARLFTHGWDLFHPTYMVVTHMWVRKRPTFWEQFTGDSKIHEKRRKLEEMGYRRLRTLFYLEAAQENDIPLVGYGMGTNRTLQQYEDYCGIQFLLQNVQPRSRKGLTKNPKQEEVLYKLGSLI